MRFVARILVPAVLVGSLAAQSDGDLLKSIDHVLGRGDRAPTIDEILGDTLGRLRGVDALSARAMAARLRESEAELRLYESLLKQVRAGLLVEVPRIGSEIAGASPEALAFEKKRVEELGRQLRDAEDAVKAVADSRPVRSPEDARSTTMADALLDVLVDVPKAPDARMATAHAADPANLSRALFQAGDYAGTLDALGQIPESSMTPEQRFCRARSLDQLGRIGEARAAYEAVVASEKDGAFGRQAAWMLKLAKTREQVAGAIGRSESRPSGGKKK
jgi:hypothetical protein